jgi:uncharacterized protein with ParB-like and HNH nuclease domain
MGRKFSGSRYQRAYAWGERQLKDFVDDLENQKVDRPYFLGTILFQMRQTDGFSGGSILLMANSGSRRSSFL